MQTVMEHSDELQIRSFLLGELSEGQRVELEKRLFRDDGYYKQILAIQEELADDYVHNNFSPAQLTSFNQNFLRSPRRRQRVEFAKVFSRALPAAKAPVLLSPRSGSWWGSMAAIIFPGSARPAFAASVVALAMLVGVVWLATENYRLSNQVKQIGRQHDSLIDQTRAHDNDALTKERELEGEIAGLRNRSSEMQTEIGQKQRELEALRNRQRLSQAGTSAGAIATFVLSPGLTRGTDEPEKLMISPATRFIRFQLDLERAGTYQGYAAEFRTARGNLVWSRSGLKMQQTAYGQAVSFTVPAELLATGEYEIALKGKSQGKVEAIGYYYIIALKK